jgi:type II secretory pathway pseudopilin PulG
MAVKPTHGRVSAGFTLVEALVAAAVFAVGVAALTPLVISQVRANDAASVRTRAVALAQEKLEEFRALPFDTGTSLKPDIVHLADGEETVDGIYTRRWHKFDPPGAPPVDAADLKRLTVSVQWDLPRRTTGSVTLVTSRSRY